MSISDLDLVVETGTGSATSNVYISRADATAYHAILGNDVWADADENDQCVALVRATQYIDQRWVFKSVALEPAQALLFPRAVLYDRNGTDVSGTVPVEIEDAACEYALEVLGDGSSLLPLAPTPDQTDPRSITYLREKVGPLETETRYDGSYGLRVETTYPMADRIIIRSGYTLGGGGGRVIR